MIKHKTDNRGFTILELMIAMGVFSGVLLLLVSTVVSVGSLYQKGIINSRTQEAARNISEQISRDMQLTSGLFAESTRTLGGFKTTAFCIGNVRYSYIEDTKLDTDVPPSSTGNKTAHHILWRDTYNGSCTPANLGIAGLPTTNGRELMAESMSLKSTKEFVEDGISSKYIKVVDKVFGDLYRINIVVKYGDIDAFDSAKGVCRPSNRGGAFCSVSSLHSEIFRQ